MSLLHRANAMMPYKIERDTQVPVTDDQRCFVVTMDDGNILRVTVTTSSFRIGDWLDIATSTSSLVGIHAEPRLFKSKLVHTSLQPKINVLFFAIGRRVLVVQQPRGNDLNGTMFIDLMRLRFYPYNFVGMNMERIHRCLNEQQIYMENTSDVGELAAGHTGREELRTAGLKKITKAVMGIDLDPVLSRRFWLERWLSDGLSPELVMQGSIRVFMALMVARTIRNYPPLPLLDQQQADSSCDLVLVLVLVLVLGLLWVLGSSHA
ncbi:hypothetical protein J5N97_006838 [Dioscorea zingiberensis]|uniref:Uncharacterized protein n=1 Tax=Dioscorea zingiberensis TaxID=325984 RepID=A0A9D5DDA9_9LILI|nr:hypothetical protein J5N97_006838 [Dioscorea zingiberensis]